MQEISEHITVEVFKTNVLETSEAEELVGTLLFHLPECTVNFDLDDCDKILRVKGYKYNPEYVVQLLNERGFQCEILQ